MGDIRLKVKGTVIRQARSSMVGILLPSREATAPHLHSNNSEVLRRADGLLLKDHHQVNMEVRLQVHLHSMAATAALRKVASLPNNSTINTVLLPPSLPPAMFPAQQHRVTLPAMPMLSAQQ